MKLKSVLNPGKMRDTDTAMIIFVSGWISVRLGSLYLDSQSAGMNTIAYSAMLVFVYIVLVIIYLTLLHYLADRKMHNKRKPIRAFFAFLVMVTAIVFSERLVFFLFSQREGTDCLLGLPNFSELIWLAMLLAWALLSFLRDVGNVYEGETPKIIKNISADEINNAVSKP